MAEQKRLDRPGLAEKIRKSREFVFELNGYKFTLARPTDVEWFDIIVGNGSSGRFLRFVVGWDNVKELDVIEHGDPHPLAFDEKVRDEWLADRSDLFIPITTALIDEYKKHQDAQEVREKNS